MTPKYSETICGQVKVTNCFSYLITSLTLILNQCGLCYQTLIVILTRAALFPYKFSSQLVFIWWTQTFGVQSNNSFILLKLHFLTSSFNEALHHKLLYCKCSPGFSRDFINFLYGSGYVWWAFFLFFSISVCFWFTGPRWAAKQLPCLPTKRVQPSRSRSGWNSKYDTLAAKFFKWKELWDLHIYIFPSIL